MNPDFKKNTVETIGKRAAYICSNPDCRVHTIGPGSIKTKTVKIGEAAHIFGARKGSKRFNPEMTEVARAEITNAIWLCRNCHKIIDTDGTKYTHNLLFKWREIHEEYITSKLGSKNDQLVFEEQKINLKEFDNYSPVIKRIIIDKPVAWEFQLTAKLMRDLNRSHFRKLEDLRNGLFMKELNFINDKSAFSWIQNRITEMRRLTMPLTELIAGLNKSWGEPGEAGDEKEIHHILKLIKNHIELVVRFEEKLTFTILPEEYAAILSLLKNVVGSNIKKLSIIPEKLDGIIEIANNYDEENDDPITINETIKLDVPQGWEKQFNLELKILERKLLQRKDKF